MSYTPKGLLECGNIDSEGAGLCGCRAQAGREELLSALLDHHKPNTCSFVPGLSRLWLWLWLRLWLKPGP